MNFKNQQKFANFKNFKHIFKNFVLAIFTQHRNQSCARIIMSKFQFLKLFIIHHCNFLHFHFSDNADE